MRIFMRGLNKGECYACRLKAAKEAFRGFDIYLSFEGDFKFEDREYHRPKINGKVIAIFSDDKTRKMPEYPDLLSSVQFFVIRDQSYTKEKQQLFEEQWLKRGKQWLMERQERDFRTVLNEYLLIIWNGNEFSELEVKFKG